MEKTCQMGEMSLKFTLDWQRTIDWLVEVFCCVVWVIRVYSMHMFHCRFHAIYVKKCPTKNVVRVEESFGVVLTHCVDERCFQLLFNFSNWGTEPIDTHSIYHPRVSSQLSLPCCLFTVHLSRSSFVLTLFFSPAERQHCFSGGGGDDTTTLGPMKIISINSNNPTIVNIKMIIKHDIYATMMMCEMWCLLGHYFVYKIELSGRERERASARSVRRSTLTF